MSGTDITFPLSDFKGTGMNLAWEILILESTYLRCVSKEWQKINLIKVLESRCTLGIGFKLMKRRCWRVPKPQFLIYSNSSEMQSHLAGLPLGIGGPGQLLSHGLLLGLAQPFFLRPLHCQVVRFLQLLIRLLLP